MGGVKLEARAEVGILSRSILFRGSNNMQWHDEIEPCPEGFDPGMCYIVTALAMEAMFLEALVCWSVCLFVCLSGSNIIGY